MIKIGRCIGVKKNSGFTMIELLAAIVVLGVLMTVAVPTVMNVLTDSRNRTYVDDAIRMSSNFETEVRKDNMMALPAIGSCVMMNLTYLDNNTFKNAPYDGEYDRVYSFVVAKRENLNDYKYYPRLVELLPKGNSGYRGVDLTEVNRLYEKKAIDNYVKNVGKNKLFDPSEKTEEEIKTQLNTYGISCNNILLYVPNMEDDDLTN